MKNYTTPAVELVQLLAEDILTVSQADNGDGLKIKFPTL